VSCLGKKLVTSGVARDYQEAGRLMVVGKEGRGVEAGCGINYKCIDVLWPAHSRDYIISALSPGRHAKLIETDLTP